jgi:glycosyltransferase involved in cell wall biosynthesis
MNAPSVSVVVPLYNKRSTLGRTLKSIQQQTFGNLEVIVVDDGSTDGGAELIADFNDNRFRLVTQANGGPGCAKNRGAGEAKSDLVAFIDADDEWEATFLETAVRQLQQHIECDAFTSNVFLGGDRKLTLWTRGKPGVFWEGAYRLKPRTAAAESSEILSAFSSCGVVYRRSTVLKYGGFFEGRCTLGEDVFLWVQVLLNHSIYRHIPALGTYHIENSELGIAAESRRTSLPIEPVLTHPDVIRNTAPVELRGWLERWLANHALRSAFLQCARGNRANAIWLMKRFPGMWRTPNRAGRLLVRIVILSWAGGRKVTEPKSAEVFPAVGGMVTKEGS